MIRRVIFALVFISFLLGDAGPDAQGDMARIAFVMTTSESSALMLVDADGDNLLKLADCAALCRDPVWSADGARVGMVDGNALLIVDVRAAERWDVRADLGTYDYRVRPDWRPDLSQAIFWSRVDMASVLRVVDTRTGSQGEIDAPNQGAAYPAWLGESTIVYVSQGIVYRQRVADSHAESLTPDSITYDNPVVSPDSSTIVIRRTGEARGGLDLLDVESGEVTPLVEGIFDKPVWSPDGERIAVNRWENGMVSLVIISVMDGGIVTITHRAALRHQPAWSTDGSQIAFVGPDPDHPHYNALFVVDTIGSSEPQPIVAKISRTAAPPNSPAFEPKGGIS